MDKYLITLASDSHHLMNENPFYIKTYKVVARTLEEANKQIEFLERQFSLEYKVFLNDVIHLWTCRIK